MSISTLNDIAQMLLHKSNNTRGVRLKTANHLKDLLETYNGTMEK